MYCVKWALIVTHTEYVSSVFVLHRFLRLATFKAVYIKSECLLPFCRFPPLLELLIVTSTSPTFSSSTSLAYLYISLTSALTNLKAANICWLADGCDQSKSAGQEIATTEAAQKQRLAEYPRESESRISWHKLQGKLCKVCLTNVCRLGWRKKNCDLDFSSLLPPVQAEILCHVTKTDSREKEIFMLFACVVSSL